MSNPFNRLFSMFGVHPTVKDIYQEINPQAKDRLFYGDIKQANKVLISITKGTFGTINDANLRTCFDIYLQVFIRAHGGLSQEFSTPQYITERLCERFSSVPKLYVTKCIKQSLDYVYQNEPKLKQQIQMYEAQKKFVAESAKKNQHLLDLHLNDEDYGLVLSKPVFVDGLSGAKIYLAQLVNSEGDDPKITRIASLMQDGITGLVDLYELTFGETEKLRIYICNYGNKNSTTAPVGLKFRA